MNISNMKIDTSLIDATQLDEAEQAVAIQLAQAYGDALEVNLMVKGGVAAIVSAIGLALRMVKANEKLQTYTLDDLSKVNPRG